MIFSYSQKAIRARPALSLYRDLLLHYPHIKFLGITFDNKITFIKNFEEILERCTHKLHCLKPDFHSRILLDDDEIPAHEKCSDLVGCFAEPFN